MLSQVQYILLVFAAWKTFVAHTKSEKGKRMLTLHLLLGAQISTVRVHSSYLSSSSLPKSTTSWLPSSQVWLYPGNMKCSFEVSRFQMIWRLKLCIFYVWVKLPWPQFNSWWYRRPRYSRLHPWGVKRSRRCTPARRELVSYFHT
jgi:hypothetical protein